MRVISKSRDHFYGTHKGAVLDLQREPDGRWYIIVTGRDGHYRYDGWAPIAIRSAKDAKAEAVRGACL